MLKLLKIYEELTYRHSNTQGAEDDEYEIGMSEDIDLPNLRLTNDINLSNEEKHKIININPNDLIISQGDFDGKIANMNIKLPWKSNINNNGIVADIQIIKQHIYQIHLQISNKIRGLGLGFKTYVALINDLGHLYSGNGRMHNNTEIPKIWSKLDNVPEFESYQNSNGRICILKNNPDKELLLSLFNN